MKLKKEIPRDHIIWQFKILFSLISNDLKKSLRSTLNNSLCSDNVTFMIDIKTELNRKLSRD